MWKIPEIQKIIYFFFYFDMSNSYVLLVIGTQLRIGFIDHSVMNNIGLLDFGQLVEITVPGSQIGEFSEIVVQKLQSRDLSMSTQVCDSWSTGVVNIFEFLVATKENSLKEL